MYRILMPLLMLVVVLLGVVFHLRNEQLIVLDYIIGSSEFYLSIWLVTAFAAGAILGMLSAMPIIIKFKRENRHLLRKTKVAEKEINNLRVMPVKD